MDVRPELAVVIGFRDWGLDRLILAIESHLSCTIANQIQVIVSDYGSQDARAVRKAVEAAGAIVVRTEVDGPWSRARCLNNGVLATTAPFALTTDADLLFHEGAHEVILPHLHARPDALHLIQCRDLPEDYSVDRIRPFDWKQFAAVSALRPRWGMGGMAAFSVEAFRQLRGYDERMEVYGGEDNDFAQRMRRTGHPLNWIDDARARIYHIWHAPTRLAVDKDEVGKNAVARNAAIVDSDPTSVRNTLHHLIGRFGRPLATIAICTRNRADHLREAIASSLAQDVVDFELIIVDDGSTDHTARVVQELYDPRVRYSYQAHSGVSVARNRAVHESRSDYVVVMDDDDIMLPGRLRHHLESLDSHVQGTYGGWIDFDNDTGELTPHQGRHFNRDALLFSGRVLAHGTSMFRRELLLRFPYKSQLRAGTDYDLILRLANAGVKLRHTGHFHILRRLHSDNLTGTLTDVQKRAAAEMTNLTRKVIRQSDEKRARQVARETPTAGCVDIERLEAAFFPYLPDRFVRRAALLPVPVETLSASARQVVPSWPRDVDPIDVKQADLARVLNARDVLLFAKARPASNAATPDTRADDQTDYGIGEDLCNFILSRFPTLEAAFFVNLDCTANREAIPLAHVADDVVAWSIGRHPPSFILGFHRATDGAALLTKKQFGDMDVEAAALRKSGYASLISGA